MLKFVFAFCALILVSVSAIYAKEDKWIDGIKIRYGTLDNRDYLTIGENKEIISTGEVNTYTKQRFPVVIVFPETLMNSWSFRQAYFDYQPFQIINDIAPSPGLGESPDKLLSVQISEARGKGLDYFYLRQKKRVRESLINTFLPRYLNSTDISQLSDNWALSHNTHRQSIIFGYLWGIFWPITDYQRILKIGFGLGFGRVENTINIFLCESYKVTFQLKNSEADLDSLKGKCLGSHYLDGAAYVNVPGDESSIMGLFHFTLWERKTENSIWKIIELDFAAMLDQPVPGVKDVKAGNNPGAGDVISYTYRF